MISSIVAAALIALAVTTALTPVVRSVARRLGAVDTPGGRRVHTAITPRMGGVAVVVGYVAALAGAWLLEPDWLWEPKIPALLGFVAGGVFIALVGAVDDVRDIGAKRKLSAQIAAAGIAWFAGAELSALDLPFFGHVAFGPVLSTILVVGWIVAFVNAINLIDGLDGLASGVVFFAAVTNTIVAIVTDNPFGAVVNAALGGSVLGFLFYNFNPATIFLGDTGSMFLGYTLGAAALLSGRQKESTLAALLVPIIAAGVPIADTLFAMVRRFLARRPIFSADRGHIHHRLLDLGLTHRRAVLTLYGASVVLCLISLLAAFGKDWQVGMAILGAMLTLVGIARFAGYFELARFRRQEEEQLHAPLTASLRRGIPRLVLAVEAADTEREVFEAVEAIVAGGPFAWAEFTPVGASGPSWRWSAAAARPDGLRVVESVLAVSPEAAGPAPAPELGVLRFGCLSQGPALPLHVDVLLRVVGDAVGVGCARAANERERASPLQRGLG